MNNNLETVNKILQDLLKESNLSVSVIQDLYADQYIVRLYTNKKLDSRYLMSTKEDGVFGIIKQMKQDILQSKLFEDIRSDLKHYEELKNMKFVLDSLDKLDIIKQSKPKLGIDKLSDL